MKLGRTSVIHFTSNSVSSILGFVATIYVARILGPEPLGTYQLAVGLVAWLAIIGNVGISRAITKRISEGEKEGAYAVAAFTTILGLFLVLTVGVLQFRSHIAAYVGFPATWYIIVMLGVGLTNGLINSILSGLHLVHINGVLSPIKTGGQAISQIGLVVVGMSTTALFLGHVLGFLVSIAVGAYFLYRELPPLQMPGREHFERLFGFAKFSWLGNLQSNMFSYTDILIMGYFVSSGLIGIYAAAWNIAHFLVLFSSTLRATLFPEMSAVSTQDDPQSTATIIEQSLTFGGLFLIPGLFGGALLSERILRIYGPEFPKGEMVLIILIIANLIMGYQNQLLNALNAIDRPELAFRVNMVFVFANIVLNLALISVYGWIGAAVATTLSVAVSLVLAYRTLSRIVKFDLPVREISRQWIAGGVMAVVVYILLTLENTHAVVRHNAAIVVTLVVIGAGSYFLSLLILSADFRETVKRNIPVDIPFIP